MNRFAIHAILGILVLAALAVTVFTWVNSASARVASFDPNDPANKAAVAKASDEGYCTPALNQILRRVLTSCGILAQGAKRGCQPLQAKNVAAMSDSDFNGLFKPMATRAGIVQFDMDSADLDDGAKVLLDKTFADQRGASYFIVVSRSSPEGSVQHNRELSEKRAASVLGYLKSKFNDPDLEQEVGLLWLGEEFAQLDDEYCKWNRSRPESECSSKELNRSAFMTWVDCRL